MKPAYDYKAQFEDIIAKRKRFNGKPFSHWSDMADELVIEAIIRAALNTDDNYSLVGFLVRKRLMEIAEKSNPTVLQRVLAQREQCIAGFNKIMVNLFG